MRPTECAVVFATPLSRPEFFGDLERGSDFLSLFASQHAALSRDGLWDLYDQSAVIVRRVIVRCKQLGAATVERAALTDFSRAVGAFKVVTLVAHWRSALFRPRDIVNPGAVNDFLRQINGTQNAASPPSPDWLAAELNKLFDPALLAPLSGDESETRRASVETHRQQLLCDRREELDRRLGSSVRGGAGVEFVDGLASIKYVTDAIPSDFDGTLDFTVCNSTLLAEEVRRRCRGGVIVSNAFPARLDVRLLLYRAALEVMTRRQMSYVDAMLDVRRRVNR